LSQTQRVWGITATEKYWDFCVQITPKWKNLVSTMFFNVFSVQEMPVYVPMTQEPTTQELPLLEHLPLSYQLQVWCSIDILYIERVGPRSSTTVYHFHTNYRCILSTTYKKTFHCTYLYVKKELYLCWRFYQCCCLAPNITYCVQSSNSQLFVCRF
jgi:hypothetical protein